MKRQALLVDLAVHLAMLAAGLYLIGQLAHAEQVAPTPPAPALVSIDRADATYGLQLYECWLVDFQYTYPVMAIDCRSDPDAIFHNGFETLPEAP